MASRADRDWRDVRNLEDVERDNRYSLHRVANAIFIVCHFAAMICHIVSFGVLLSKNQELRDNTDPLPGSRVCILYMDVGKNTVGNKSEDIVTYEGGHSCEFAAFGSVVLTILAIIMMICLVVRTIFINKMNHYGVIDVVEIVPAIVLTFIISVTISIGRSVTCSNLTQRRYESCSEAEVPIDKRTEGPRIQIYSALKSTETSSWVAFLFLFVVAVLSILRTILWFRKLRKSRSLDVSPGLVNYEAPPAVDDEGDKTPAAI